ncbi:SAM-dependent methyltransferase [Flavobacterium endophyticum]|uniref:SAM-dependent methyltransferase n=1 Tax=Flavobacterium endophyticum TaxID=1540163 RepID=A0A495M8J6_9FLAO|nr:class I SAM-dependent methyltransferase [Flavobacterium endophyticum]RKS21768.1 SAM-dependent methyltransferase [Flavobacterium endophyticum]
MTDDMKLYWKLYSEWFPNERILSKFNNPIRDYSIKNSGKVIDIGCGQSTYLLDLLDSNYELFAVDTNEMQLQLLKDRVIKSGNKAERINYSSTEFPSDNFKGNYFTAIIISNLLHFFKKNDAYNFVSQLNQYSESGTLILVTVHSSSHLSNKKEITDKSYFKSFYSKSDLYEMFPSSDFEYIGYIEKEKLPNNYKIKFIKHWINEVYKEKYTPNQIRKIQQNYLKTCRINSIDFLVKKH